METPSVLRFNNKNPQGRKPPRNYFSRREQYRLLGLVFALGFVILMVSHASNPATWSWFSDSEIVAAKNTSGSQTDTSSQHEEPSAANIDTRHRPQPIHPLPLDTVRLGKQPEEASAVAEAAAGYFPGVIGDQLREIRDNQPFRPGEAAAWFNLLAVLRDADPAALESHAAQVGFVQLYQQPEAWRGQVVTFNGIIRRIKVREVGKNKEGITQYYELVLKPQAGPPRPVMAYVLNLPEALKSRGDDIDEPIQLTGFFFKNWVYAGQQATYVAPVLLARDVRWSPPLVTPVYFPPWGLIAAVVLGSLLAASSLAYLAYYVSQRNALPPPAATPEEMAASVALMAEYDAPQEFPEDAQTPRHSPM